MKELPLWRTRAVWIAAVVAALFLWWRFEPSRDAIPAVVSTSRHQIGSADSGRVAAVYVRPGDQVRAGAPLAQLDCSEVDAEIGVERGVLSEYLAELEAMTAELAAEVRRRRLEVETELAQTRANLALAKGEQEAREAELKMLTEQLDRLDEVVRNRVAQADRLTDLRARQERLAREAVHGPEALSAWAESVGQVRRALESMESDDPSVRLQPLSARVETQSQRLERLLERRERCTLRAPVDGTVSEVFHASGNTIPAGASVAAIVSTRVLDVVGYAPPESLHTLAVSNPVLVYSQQRRSTARGVVERVGPEIVEMPARLWPMPDRPRYGRPVHIRLEESAGLLPGDIAYIEPQRGAAEAATATSHDTVAVGVPRGLLERTRLEPSGAVWLPTRQRFLIASDDTGFAGPGEHPPWLFLADSAGRFEPEPLPLAGIDSISDLEALTRAPDGTLYLLASQSLSRDGRRPRKRQWLLRVAESEERLIVTGKVALYDDTLSVLPIERRIELGVSDQLDIEGLAWHRGGLIVGLKSPLDAAGRARLWYLPEVDSVFSTPRRSSEVLPWGALSLQTCAAGAPGGISDLFLEDARLYVLSTLPEGPPCGSAWVMDLPLDKAMPRKLADWPDLKPEGMARAGTGELVIFFDRGTQTPRLTRLAEK
jgi:multidrug resistance efflux pump